MSYSLLKFLHVFAIIVWVGGMFFTQFALRPAVQSLEPGARVRLMQEALGRFFNIALGAALLTLLSGLWMIGSVAKTTVQAGGQFAMPLSWTIMATLGILMIAIFGHIRFALYKRLKRAVQAQDPAAGALALGSIRMWVQINLAFGIVIVGMIFMMS